jgi:hypothetical protein
MGKKSDRREKRRAAAIQREQAQQAIREKQAREDRIAALARQHDQQHRLEIAATKQLGERLLEPARSLREDRIAASVTPTPPLAEEETHQGVSRRPRPRPRGLQMALMLAMACLAGPPPPEE